VTQHIGIKRGLYENCYMRRFFILIIVGCVLHSCDPGHTTDLSGSVDAYVPIYSTLAEINKIQVEPQKPTEQAGKIYAYGNYIFQNDLNSGIHIIDNKDRTHPKKIAFLKLPFSTEIAVKGNYLYSNNYVDLVVFDISDPSNPKLIKRVKDVFPATDQKYPPLNTGYFQCPDQSKGTIVRWELKNIPIPNCRR
jgi:hypothetical protein